MAAVVAAAAVVVGVVVVVVVVVIQKRLLTEKHNSENSTGTFLPFYYSHYGLENSVDVKKRTRWNERAD